MLMVHSDESALNSDLEDKDNWHIQRKDRLKEKEAISPVSLRQEAEENLLPEFNPLVPSYIEG
jgi:hypothetical protein